MAEDGDIYTIGHSTHELAVLIGLLRRHEVETVADVRRFPGSRRNPQFNAKPLRAAMAAERISLEQLGPALGGRRRPQAGSPNGGWRVDGFRAYADHMATPEFSQGLAQLQTLASATVTALMCAEADWHRCHRRLIADALLARGWRVLHIGSDGDVSQHTMTPFALVREESISYPPAQQELA